MQSTCVYIILGPIICKTISHTKLCVAPRILDRGGLGWRDDPLMVTRLAWMAHRLQSSIKCTMKSSVAYRARKSQLRDETVARVQPRAAAE